MALKDPPLWQGPSSPPYRPKVPATTLDTRSTRRPSVTRPELVPDVTSPTSPISPWPPTHRRLASSSSLPTSPTESKRPPHDRPRSEQAQNGYLALVAIRVLYALYLVWSILPPAWARRVGLGWMPDREWSTIIPSFLIVTVLLTYSSYGALMAYHTPGFSSLSLIADSRGQQPKALSETGINTFVPLPPGIKLLDEPIDVPLSVMNRRLFPPRKRPRELQRASS